MKDELGNKQDISMTSNKLKWPQTTYPWPSEKTSDSSFEFQVISTLDTSPNVFLHEHFLQKMFIPLQACSGDRPCMAWSGEHLSRVCYTRFLMKKLIYSLNF